MGKKRAVRYHNDKRGQVVSLMATMIMIFVAMLFVGLCLNWNLFYIIGGAIPIIIVGLMIIYIPGVLKGIYFILKKVVDRKITKVAKMIQEVDDRGDKREKEDEG
jgi:hypothetical protein